MLTQLRQHLAQHQAQSSYFKLPQAGVCLLITQSDQPEIIFTQRAAHLSSHSGQVAFPGGKRDPQDADILATALRETHEEIGLAPEKIQVLGRLSDVISLHGLKVTPFVGLIAADLDLHPCEAEIASVFQVPLAYFAQDPRQRTDLIYVGEQAYYVPSYLYQGYEIWGLSAMMLVELLALAYQRDFNVLTPPKATCPLWVRPKRAFTHQKA
ncbi:NUDIX domain-containing protein [Allopseudospirillum japonicum]|uniref:NUDIX domain-containing protein n=1 Tax=Allopseudospirillum japonicum TaxID=64971 RepID=A0A1H6R3R4_9GAMM|nr:CoA pyrophosphatase [Allopseudospirillum japonicum]SEI47854.1 NUDIX domain-containing protein [Allopseudospirillum japonicum]